MKISALDAIPVSLPLARQVSLSTGTRVASQHVLVVVETDDGVRGYAECTPRPTLYGESVATAVAIIKDELAPQVVGLSVGGMSAVLSRLSRLAENRSARSAVEIAVFDAYARTIGASCLELLGGYTSTLPLCAILGYGKPQEIADQASALAERWGVTAFKLKIGQVVDTDVEAAHVLRDRLGANVVLYADANQQYSVWDALRYLDGTKHCDLRWVEEPTRPEHHSELTRRRSYSLLADESVADVKAAFAAMRERRCQGVSIKPARSGLRDSNRIRELALMEGVTPIIGSQGDAVIGALTAAAFAAGDSVTAVEAAELLFFTEMAEDLITELPEIRGGALSIPLGPGFGFNVDPDKVMAHRVDGRT